MHPLFLLLPPSLFLCLYLSFSPSACILCLPAPAAAASLSATLPFYCSHISGVNWEQCARGTAVPTYGYMCLFCYLTLYPLYVPLLSPLPLTCLTVMLKATGHKGTCNSFNFSLSLPAFLFPLQLHLWLPFLLPSSSTSLFFFLFLPLPPPSVCLSN